ncbi:MAG: YdcF family protein [Desulfatiglandales bacterium]
MFLLKKLVTPFLIPPGIFSVLLFLLAFFVRRHKRGFWASVSLGLLIWASSTEIISHTLILPLERVALKEASDRGDVIVLLGGGLKDLALDLSGRGTPGEEAAVRLNCAYRLWLKTGLPLIVSGGSVFEGKGAEAAVLKRILIHMGVEESKIIGEDKSRDTFENLRFIKEICEKKGFKDPIVVTSAFHVRRVLAISKRIGLRTAFLPCGFKTWEERRFFWHEYLPSIGGLRESSVALREYLGLLFLSISQVG